MNKDTMKNVMKRMNWIKQSELIDTDRIHRSSIKQQWIDSKTANEGLTNAMQVFNTNIQT